MALGGTMTGVLTASVWVFEKPTDVSVFPHITQFYTFALMGITFTLLMLVFLLHMLPQISRFYNFTLTPSTFLFSFALIGITFTLLVLGVFVSHHSTPVVRACGRS